MEGELQLETAPDKDHFLLADRTDHAGFNPV